MAQHQPLGAFWFRSLLPHRFLVLVLPEKKISELCVCIYTDGSKIDDPITSVASALFDQSKNYVTTWKLNLLHTVLAGELYALLKALEYISLHRYTWKVVFTDSLSSLQMITSDNSSYCDTVSEIRYLLTSFNRTSTVFLHWVKFHVGVFGNEVADKAANKGHSNDKRALYPLHLEELTCLIKRNFLIYFDDYWKQACTAQNKGSFHRRIKLWITIPTPVLTGKRQLDSVIFRLRLGHAGVLQHNYRFGMSDTNLCHQCNEEESITHFLLDCDIYNHQRTIFHIELAQLTLRPLHSLCLQFWVVMTFHLLWTRKSWTSLQNFYRPVTNWVFSNPCWLILKYTTPAGILQQPTLKEEETKWYIYSILIQAIF